ncbi:uncharacterized protein EHS24_008355 [Apiotrichum porosum]|uniref:CS domain-containing protein n=1 Tax=Apiotrichum porosum TaxID=105984 RepID=A0A427XQ04_9TREE|nr:uncharacterized protein EHS24_008355 [Apiotrichum porosum]RSH80926.1 hypothetical protein EHS24_008355 [Apiotrichum porosum]
MATIPPRPLHPEILYAERSSETEPEKNIIYLTINVADINGEPRLDITKDQISFSAVSGTPDKGIPTKEWAFDLDLWGEIDPTKTKKVVHGRAVVLVLQKKELRAEYWPRLTKEKPNRNWIRTDFAKWVDEDEQEGEELEAPDAGMGGGMPGMPGMGGMGGMPGMGGMGGMGGGGMEDLMAQMGGMGGMMGGMGGAGGGMPGGMDFAKLMEQMGGAGALGGGMPDGDDLDEVDDAAPAAKEVVEDVQVEEVE